VGEDGAVTDEVTTGKTRERVIGAGLAWTAIWSLRWLLIVGGTVLMGIIVRETWVVVLPVVLALILTSVLEAPARLLERRLRFPVTLAAATALIGGIGLLVGIGFAIAPSVADQSDEIAADTAAGLQKIQDWVQENDLVTEDQISSAIQELQARVTESASTIASGVLAGVGAVGSGLVTLFITLILTFLFLKDGRRFLPWVDAFAGPHAGPHLREVLGQCWATLGGFIRTQAIVSFIDAVLIGIGLLVVGVPLAVPLAILTFFGGFIPIVGAIVVGAVAVLVALVSVGVTGALIVLAVIIGVQQLEGNVLQPWLQSKTMQLHAAVVLLSLTLGSTLFGITGAFLAVPVAAVVAVVLRYLSAQVDREAAPGVEPEPEPDPGPVGDPVAGPPAEGGQQP
jgi:putative heme transporter